MTKTLLLTVVLGVAASTAAAQSVPLPAPAAPVPPADAAMAAPAAPAASPQQPSPPQAPSPAPAPFVFAAPPSPPVAWPPFNDVFADVSIDWQAAALALDRSLAATTDWLLAPQDALRAQKPSAAPMPPARPRPFAGAFDEPLYDQARAFIERNQYERALPVLERVIDARGTRADAAMYWKAYSLSKLARRGEALTALADLQKQFPNGAWVKDARALDVEIRQASGQSVPADIADDELKLLALRGLLQNDPEAVVPALEKMLAGNSSVRVKDRALFVLSQSRATRARDIISSMASGGSNPELRLSAVRYLAMRSDPESLKILSDLYSSSSDADVKRAILQSMLAANAVDRLTQIARTEKDANLQRAAIRNLGALNRPEAAESLRAVYLSAVPIDTKKAVIEALAMHRNASVLVALARAERNPELKTEMVRQLSTMRAPEARDYMLELLK